MAQLSEARVPDIGGSTDVPVIEILVQVGDTVRKDQGLVTLESDKATMEVPSSVAGKIVELKVKVGDKLSEGSVVAIVEAEGAADAPAAKETGELAAKAREGKLSPAEMSGGCFSISSLGGIGGTSFTPIVNAPEVAILGVSKSAMKPVWDGKQFVPRLILPLSLSYDHRVIDGAAAARFTAFLAQLLGDMRRATL